LSQWSGAQTTDYEKIAAAAAEAMKAIDLAISSVPRFWWEIRPPTATPHSVCYRRAERY